MFATGLFDDTREQKNRRILDDATSTEHEELTRLLSQDSTILLKNEKSVLPLDNTKISKIAVIGDQLTTAGGGSGGVIPSFISLPIDAIDARLKARPSICSFEYGIDYYQPLNPSVRASDEHECCSLCASTDKCTHFSYTSSTCYLKSSNDGRVEKASVISGACYNMTEKTTTYTDLSNADKVYEAVKDADVAVLVVATSSSEGGDRSDLGTQFYTLHRVLINVIIIFFFFFITFICFLFLGLSASTETIIAGVLAIQPNTVVVVRGPGAVTMPW